MEITQALIAAGGKGSRLQVDDPKLAGPKALLEIRGHPLLYWQLGLLHAAGINEVIIAVDMRDRVCDVQRAIEGPRQQFRDVRIVCDLGLGTHGIPAQLSNLLHDSFLFDAGHSFLPPDHYRRLMAAKKLNAWAVSAFIPAHNSSNRSRMEIPVGNSQALGPVRAARESRCLALPYALDRDYCVEIVEAAYDVRKAFRRRLDEHRLEIVESSFPPEFDITDEMNTSYVGARSFLRSSNGKTVGLADDILEGRGRA